MKRFFPFFLLLAVSFPVLAQKRISLLTCGTGEELYSLFGHAAIRITDTVRGTDEVYNYGTFNGFEENFEIKYLRGKLLYYLAKESFGGFLQTYIAEGRSVQEQELLLDSAAKEKLQMALEENLLPQNAAYKYDFLYDNCATRIRDIFPKTFGVAYKAGGAENMPYKTFRNSIDDYLRPRPWEGFGIDILLGSPVDKAASPLTIQYLPHYLQNGVAHSLFRGKLFAAPSQTILEEQARKPLPLNSPFWLNLGLLLLSILLWSIKRLHPAAEVLGRTLFFVTGLLGILILFMWFGTDHTACGYNWNILWLLPAGLVGAFLRRKTFGRYAALATGLLATALLIHLAGIQALPLATAWPLLAALGLNYGMIYRRNAGHTKEQVL